MKIKFFTVLAIMASFAAPVMAQTPEAIEEMAQQTAEAQAELAATSAYNVSQAVTYKMAIRKGLPEADAQAVAEEAGLFAQEAAFDATYEVALEEARKYYSELPAAAVAQPHQEVIDDLWKLTEVGELVSSLSAQTAVIYSALELPGYVEGQESLQATIAAWVWADPARIDLLHKQVIRPVVVAYETGKSQEIEMPQELVAKCHDAMGPWDRLWTTIPEDAKGRTLTIAVMPVPAPAAK